MENQFISDIQPQRPASLTRLCILSFTMTGLSAVFCLLILLSLLFSPRHSYEFHQNSFLDFMPIINSLLIFLANFISLSGVILMWKMKKKGYLIYVLAETIPWITSVLTLKVILHESSQPLITSLGTIFMIVFDVIFIFLYSKNLKHMK